MYKEFINRNRLKIAITIFSVFTLFFVYNTFIAGSVTVITNNPEAEVFIVDDDNTVRLVGTGERVKLKAGQGTYTVTVRTSSSETWATAVVPRFFKGDDLSIELIDTKQPTTLYPIHVQSLATNNNVIRYLPASNTSVRELDIEKNILDTIGLNEPSVRILKWVNFNSAIGVNNLGQVFWLNGRNFKVLNGVRGQVLNDSSFASNSKGQIVVATTEGLYYLSSPNSAPTLISDAVEQGSSVYISENDQILVVGSPALGSDNASLETGDNESIVPIGPQLVELYSSSGDTSSLIIDNSSGVIENIAWSPNGDGFVYQSGASIFLYSLSDNTSTLLVKSSLALLNKILWQNNTLFLHIGTNVWRYSFSNSQLQKLSSDVEGTTVPGSVYLEGNAISFSARSSQLSQGNIYRVSF